MINRGIYIVELPPYEVRVAIDDLLAPIPPSLPRDFTVLNAALAAVEIGDPIRTLLNPVIEFRSPLNQPDTGRPALAITITSIDAFSGKPGHPVVCERILPDQMLRELAQDARKLATFVRGLLLDLLEHEVNESITLYGKYVVAPHGGHSPPPR